MSMISRQLVSLSGRATKAVAPETYSFIGRLLGSILIAGLAVVIVGLALSALVSIALVPFFDKLKAYREKSVAFATEHPGAVNPYKSKLAALERIGEILTNVAVWIAVGAWIVLSAYCYDHWGDF